MTIIKNLIIQKLVFQGYGLGFDNNNTYFVQNALPGDVLDVEVLYTKSKSYFCQIIKILKSSPLRKNIRCSIGKLCGACDWVNIDYNQQLAFKNMFIKDLFTPLQQSISLPQIIPSPVIDYYRNKSLLPVQIENNKPIIGMYAKQSHNVIEHTKCFLHPEIFNQIIQDIKEWIILSKVKIYDEQTLTGNLRHIGFRCSFDQQSIIIILVTKTTKLPFTKQLIHLLTNKYKQIKGIIQNINKLHTNTILGESDKILFGQDFYLEHLEALNYKINYKAFFQVNIPQAINIYNHIKKNISNDPVVLDAYSGTGSIGLFIASQAKKVVFVESNTQAHQSAIENAYINNINNIEFRNAEVNNVIDNITQENLFNTVIFDPPRKGLEPETIELISKKNIPQIIYLSCNPSTQIRDVNLFIKHHYKIKEISAFDMFPHTFHIESLIILEKT